MMGTGNTMKNDTTRKLEDMSKTELHAVYRPDSFRELSTAELAIAVALETKKDSDEAEIKSRLAAEEAAFRADHLHTLQPQNRKMVTQSLGGYRNLHPEWVPVIEQWHAAVAAKKAEKAAQKAAAAAEKAATVKVPAQAPAAAQKATQAVEKLAQAEDPRVSDLQAQVGALTALVTKLASELGVEV